VLRVAPVYGAVVEAFDRVGADAAALTAVREKLATG
jgi:hypothetical protein